MLKKLLLLCAVIYFSCEESTPIRDNPLDDESGDYVQLYGSVVHEEVIPGGPLTDSGVKSPKGL